MRLTAGLSLLILASAFACSSKPPEAPLFKKIGSGNATGTPGGGSGTEDGGSSAVDGNGDGIPDGPTGTIGGEPATSASLELINTKFKADTAKLQLQVKFAGYTSEKLKLEDKAGIASVSLPKLPAGKTDTLTVEIYEGAKLRYKASRPKVTIEKGKANQVAIEDCLIQKLPWTGEANENLCGWTVSDVKN